MFDVIHLETGEVIRKFKERGEAEYFKTDVYGPEADQFTVRASSVITNYLIPIQEKELDKLLLLSFLGRATYKTDVVRTLIKKYKQHLSPFSKELIIKELKSEETKDIEWEKFLEEINE